MRCLAVAEWIKSDFEVNFIPSNFEAQIATLVEQRGFSCVMPQQPSQLLIADGYTLSEADLKPFIQDDTQVIWIADFSVVPPSAAGIVNHAPGITRAHYAKFYGPLGLGLSFAMVAPFFFSSQPKSSQSNTALVCLGGSDWNNLTLQIAQWILACSDFEVHAVVGPFYEHKTTINQLKISFPERFTWSQNLDQVGLAGAMQSAAFGVFSASNTLYEAIAAQLPAIAGYYTDNQLGIYNGFTQMGLAWGCDGFDERQFKKQLKDLSAEVIAQRKKQLQQLWVQQPGDGWRQLLQQLSKDSGFSMRAAMADDCRLYFDWANEPEVRLQAFSSEPIVWEAHQTWFLGKIQSAAAHLFVMEHKGIPVGQIRFDLHNGYWWIDYSIARDFRGQSLSKTLLCRGLQKMRGLYGSAPIRAEVKLTNLPSQRAFESIQAQRITTDTRRAIVTYDLSI